MKYFEHLSQDEMDILSDAIPQITILIAGADGVIDRKETEWAKKVTQIRTYASDEELRPFYTKMGLNYQERLDYFLDVLPEDVAARTKILSTELEKVNPILPKLDPEIGYLFYRSLVTFARHVAESSGGFLRFGSISKEEAALISLPMITPIEKPKLPEEDTNEA